MNTITVHLTDAMPQSICGQLIEYHEMYLNFENITKLLKFPFSKTTPCRLCLIKMIAREL